MREEKKKKRNSASDGRPSVGRRILQGRTLLPLCNPEKGPSPQIGNTKFVSSLFFFFFANRIESAIKTRAHKERMGSRFGLYLFIQSKTLRPCFLIHFRKKENKKKKSVGTNLPSVFHFIFSLKTSLKTRKWPINCSSLGACTPARY